MNPVGTGTKPIEEKIMSDLQIQRGDADQLDRMEDALEYQRKVKLCLIGSNARVFPGEMVVDSKGNKEVISSFEAPKHAASSGRLYVRNKLVGMGGSVFPHVFGCHFTSIECETCGDDPVIDCHECDQHLDFVARVRGIEDIYDRLMLVYAATERFFAGQAWHSVLWHRAEQHGHKDRSAFDFQADFNRDLVLACEEGGYYETGIALPETYKNYGDLPASPAHHTFSGLITFTPFQHSLLAILNLGFLGFTEEQVRDIVIKSVINNPEPEAQ